MKEKIYFAMFSETKINYSSIGIFISFPKWIIEFQQITNHPNGHRQSRVNSPTNSIIRCSHELLSALQTTSKLKNLTKYFSTSLNQLTESGEHV